MLKVKADILLKFVEGCEYRIRIYDNVEEELDGGKCNGVSNVSEVLFDTDAFAWWLERVVSGWTTDQDCKNKISSFHHPCLSRRINMISSAGLRILQRTSNHRLPLLRMNVPLRARARPSDAVSLS